MACADCQGVGWIFTEKNGRSGAHRCPCSLPRQDSRMASGHALTRQKVEDAVGRLGALEFFPKGPEERMAIAELLLRMVSTQEQLAWLVATMMDRVGRWHGSLELRGVFCSRFDPKDGIQATCSLSIGFTAEAFESRAALPQAKERKALAPVSRALLAEYVPQVKGVE